MARPYTLDQVADACIALVAYRARHGLTWFELRERLHTYQPVIDAIPRYAAVAKARRISGNVLPDPAGPIPGHVVTAIHKLLTSKAPAALATKRIQNDPELAVTAGHTYGEVIAAAQASRAYRDSRGWSQERMARYIGYHVKSIANLERRTGYIPKNLPEEILRLCKRFNREDRE